MVLNKKNVRILRDHYIREKSMTDQERRKRTRVPFQVLASLQAADGDVHIDCETKNLSVSGVLVLGAVGLTVGSRWTIKLVGGLQNSAFCLWMEGKVARKVNNGGAIAFVDMDEDCYALLQTIVLYNADDPIAAAEEFSRGFEAG